MGLPILKAFKKEWHDQTCILKQLGKPGGLERMYWKLVELIWRDLVKRLSQWSSWGIIVTWTRAVPVERWREKCVWEVLRREAETREDKVKDYDQRYHRRAEGRRGARKGKSSSSRCRGLIKWPFTKHLLWPKHIVSSEVNTPKEIL